MGCGSSTDAQKPTKTIIIQQQEPVQHVIPVDNTPAVINERKRVQIEEEDKYRREALELAQSKRREAELRAPKPNKEKHSKLLDIVDDKFKSLQANFIHLHENLRKNDKEDQELPTINRNIKNDASDIENNLEDLQAKPFPNDKEYLKALKKIVQFSKNLELEHQQLRKKLKKYPEYKKTVLALLGDQYGDLFEESVNVTQSSIRKSGVLMSPKSELKAATSGSSPPRNYLDRSVIRDDKVLGRVGEPLPPVPIAFDDPFDREMAAVMQKQRDDVAFELENAVREYERLQMDFNVLKTRQENLQKDYRLAQQEIKDLQHGNKQVMNVNNAMGAENGSFKDSKNEVVRKHEQTKQACVNLEKELAELRAMYTQKVTERDALDLEHEFRVHQLEYEIKRKQDEARDIDRSRKEEEVRVREDERRIIDDERRREEHDRKRRDIDRKRQEDDRRRVEEDKIRREEVRRVEARIEEVDRQRRNLMLDPLPPVVSDFSVSVPVVRDVRASIHINPVSMPTMLPPIYPGEADRRLQEDVRRIQMMNEEADRKRAHMLQQLNAPIIVEAPTMISAPIQMSPPIRFEDIVLPTKYTSMGAETQMIPMRSSLMMNEYPVTQVITHSPVRAEKSFIVDHERPKMEGALSALEMARRARMGADRGQIAAVMDHKRVEVQNIPINYQGGFGY